MALILVTGASSGLGRNTARVLAGDGRDVVVHVRNLARLTNEDDTARWKGVIIRDLADLDETRDVARQAAEFGRFDAVIHNAGTAYYDDTSCGAPPSRRRSRPGGTERRAMRSTPAGSPPVASVLRSIFPPPLVSKLALEGSEVVDGTFIDDELRERQCDVLLRTRLDGRTGFVYVLVEHQSTPDPLMAYRVHRYMGRIWERYLREHPKATRLPVILPVVIYQGPRPWTAPVELRDVLTSIRKKLQDLLGDYQDAVMTLPVLHKLDAASAAGGHLARLRRWCCSSALAQVRGYSAGEEDGS